MKTLALLYILLATGEAGVEVIDTEICHQVPRAILDGLEVSASMLDGRDVEITSAACFDVQPIGDCGDEV